MDDIYSKNGFKDRRDYLFSLSLDFGIPFSVVHSFADLLGPEEDFDGLIVELEYYSDIGILS